jgi:hypothetical protein
MKHSNPESEKEPAPNLLNTQKAAAYLDIGTRTLADWRAAKVIPVIERPG